jgi:hypothetical protein
MRRSIAVLGLISKWYSGVGRLASDNRPLGGMLEREAWAQLGAEYLDAFVKESELILRIFNMNKTIETKFMSVFCNVNKLL